VQQAVAAPLFPVPKSHCFKVGSSIIPFPQVQEILFTEKEIEPPVATCGEFPWEPELASWTKGTLETFKLREKGTMAGM